MPLRQVLLDPFALTLWSYLQVLRLEREESVDAARERLEQAALLATGFHDPSALRKYELDYLRQAGLLQSVLSNVKQRAAEMIEEHQKLAVKVAVHPKKHGEPIIDIS